MRRVAFPLFLLGAGMAGEAQRPRVLLAVFAHADDEIFAAGPVLARYAREGVKVYLAIATKGEKGTHSNTWGPDKLAEVRRAEAKCSCQQLGIEPPIFFELSDGELGDITEPLGQNVQAVADGVKRIILKLNPQVVVTWGPEGGYGHPDHRLVSDGVTQVIQSSNTGIRLYYAGFTAQQAKMLNSDWPHDIPWHTADPSYLLVRVSYTEKDKAAYHRALECHESQFTHEEDMTIENDLDVGWGGHVSFREWNGGQQSQDLFK